MFGMYMYMYMHINCVRFRETNRTCLTVHAWCIHVYVCMLIRSVEFRVINKTWPTMQRDAQTYMYVYANLCKSVPWDWEVPIGHVWHTRICMYMYQERDIQSDSPKHDWQCSVMYTRIYLYIYIRSVELELSIGNV